MDGVTERTETQVVSPRLLGGGFAVLRIMFGAVWLSNGLANWDFFAVGVPDRATTVAGTGDRADRADLRPGRTLAIRFAGRWPF